jgi:cytochrome c oxidase subunit IV
MILAVFLNDPVGEPSPTHMSYKLVSPNGKVNAIDLSIVILSVLFIISTLIYPVDPAKFSILFIVSYHVCLIDHVYPCLPF